MISMTRDYDLVKRICKVLLIAVSNCAKRIGTDIEVSVFGVQPEKRTIKEVLQ